MSWTYHFRRKTVKINLVLSKAYVFPGQGAQFVGMGKDLYEESKRGQSFIDKANEILGYRITDIMFGGTDEKLRQTKVPLPAIILHSVITAFCHYDLFFRRILCTGGSWRLVFVGSPGLVQTGLIGRIQKSL